MPAGVPTVDPGTRRGRVQPYVQDIKIAAGEQPSWSPSSSSALLAAVGLRETWMGWAPGYFPTPGYWIGWGDSGHGFGFWQSDDGSYPDFPRSEEALTVLGQARAAARHLTGSFRVLRLAFPGVDGPLLRRAAICAYNARIGRVATQLATKKEPDLVTTRGPSGQPDYGSHVELIAQKLRLEVPTLT